MTHDQDASQDILIDKTLLIIRASATKIQSVRLDEGSKILGDMRVSRNGQFNRNVFGLLGAAYKA